MTDNTLTIAGNLTRDPELRFTTSGQATASFSIAVKRTSTDRQTGQRRESASFFDVVAWGCRSRGCRSRGNDGCAHRGLPFRRSSGSPPFAPRVEGLLALGSGRVASAADAR